MSRGIGALANKILEDDESVIYEYGSYNLNDSRYRNENRMLDGTIFIPKSCFAEPELHEKLKKMPNGKKKFVIKRVPVNVNYRKMLEDGEIKVSNCSNCWKITDDGIDAMICHILFHLFCSYQEHGVIPENIAYNV